MQCKLYDEENLVNINDQDENRVYRNEKIPELLRSGKATWSSLWIENDRSKFFDDPNFLSILDYVKNNTISENSNNM